MEHTYTCKKCAKEFVSVRLRKYCSHECFAKRFDPVNKTCETCGKNFVVAYRFRGQKTCGVECAKVAISKTLTTSETKRCLVCNAQYTVVQSYKDNAKYCSYECFLSTRKTRQPDVMNVCEGCGKNFTVSYVRAKQRFCSKSCAHTGERNGMFGKPGSMTGKPPWSKNKSKETDERLKRMGEKISHVLKEQFSSGKRSHAGQKNPNFGNTSDTLSVEKRRNFSTAAINRVLSGVSGYKTGHITGEYMCKKSSKNVNFKSSWELAAMMWWDRNSNIRMYEYESRIIHLPDGRRAIPDFVLEYIDGTIEYVEIKPTPIQNLDIVKQKLDMIKEQLQREGAKYVLLGDDEIKLMIRDLGSAYDDAIKLYKNRF